MEPDENGGNPYRINRREALKRAALVTGAAWAAPVLTSLRTPAFANYGFPPCAAPCPDCFDQNNPVCDQEGPSENPCYCAETTEGDCFCGSTIYTGQDEEVCTTSDDCTPPNRCMQLCGTYLTCVGPCGWAF